MTDLAAHRARFGQAHDAVARSGAGVHSARYAQLCRERGWWRRVLAVRRAAMMGLPRPEMHG